jgi:ribonuclease-3
VAAGRAGEPPQPRLLAEVGPHHATTFTVECRLEGEPRGRGTGRSKKVAEQVAAAQALTALGAAP